MGFRFRKSVSLGKGVRLNFSKRGMGLSFGSRGARFSIGPGGARSTIGIPGTGISYETRSGSGRPRTSASQATAGVSDAAVMGCFVWAIGIFIYLVVLFTASTAWKIIATLSGVGLIVLNSKMRQKEMELKEKAEAARIKAEIEHEEADARQAEEVKSKQLEPLKECPIQLKKNEIAYYITDATLLEDRVRGSKIIGTGKFILTSRKAYFLTDTTTTSFDLGKILNVEVHSDSIEIIREGKTQNQFYVTEFPQTLAAYIAKAMELREM